MNSAAPAWLAELAEAVARCRINPDGSNGVVESAEFLNLRRRILEGSAADGCSLWARWFLAPPEMRTLSPSSHLTMPEYVRQRLRDAAHEIWMEGVLETLVGAFEPPIGEENAEIVKQAAQLLPNDGRVLACVGPIRLRAEDQPGPRHINEAVWWSRRAVSLAPEEPRAWRSLAQALQAAERFPEALEAIERALALSPSDTVLWRIKASILARSNRLEESCQAYTRIVELTDPGKVEDASAVALAKDRRRGALRDRSEIRKRMGLTAEATADFLSFLNIPQRDPETPSHLLDLTPHYNAGFDELLIEAESGARSCLPHGVHSWAGVPFDIRGRVVVVMDFASGGGGRVTELPVRRRCQRLHFLHSARDANAPEPPFVKFLIHYSDGQVEEITAFSTANPSDKGKAPLPDTTHFSLHQKEILPDGSPSDTGLRLARTQWTNPRPDAEVSHIDMHLIVEEMPTPFLFAGGQVFLVAITAE